MNTLAEAHSPAPLDRLTLALVDWGAAASQIVAHMELTRRSTETPAPGTPAEVFRGVLAELLTPMLAGRESEVEQAADLVAAIEAKVREEICLVPPPAPPWRRGKRRRGG